MTNLGKSREEIIFELVKSLNQGDSFYVTRDGLGTPRVDVAIRQYDAMVAAGIVVEIEEVK